MVVETTDSKVCVVCVVRHRDRRVLKDKASTCRSDDRPSHGDSGLR